MAFLNDLKIITAIITVILSFIAGYIEIKKNPKYWLNRWFALFYVSFAFGFLLYTLYHLFTTHATWIIPTMITAHALYNLGLISILMATFVLKHSEKVAMSPKYLGIAFILFMILTIGYFIWMPVVNMENFNQGIVDTETPTGLFIVVNVLRVAIITYVLYNFGIIMQKASGKSKERAQWFFGGSIVLLLGIFLNLFGGLLGSVLFEIFGLISFDIGLAVTVKGFLIE